METFTIRINPDKVKQIISEYYKLNDTRVHCVVDYDGSWKGLVISVYDKDIKEINPKQEKEIYDYSGGL